MKKHNYAYIIHTNSPKIQTENWIPFEWKNKIVGQGMSTHEEWYWIFKKNDDANEGIKRILKLNEDSKPKMKLKKIRINLNKKEIPIRFEGPLDN